MRWKVTAELHPVTRVWPITARPPIFLAIFLIFAQFLDLAWTYLIILTFYIGKCTYRMKWLATCARVSSVWTVGHRRSLRLSRLAVLAPATFQTCFDLWRVGGDSICRGFIKWWCQPARCSSSTRWIYRVNVTLLKVEWVEGNTYINLLNKSRLKWGFASVCAHAK